MTTLTDVLKQDVENMYAATAALFKRADEDNLDWKPETGKNWMTTGQVMKHCTNACGVCIKGFVTGDWGLPEGVKFEDIPPEEMMAPAEQMETVKSTEDALNQLEEDKQVALKFIVEAGEENLLNKRLSAPWGGSEKTLFQHLNDMVWHLGQHKGQLYYYLKLQGQDVNTQTLWGG